MARLGNYQADLFAQGRPRVDGAAAIARHGLDGSSWVDLGRRWLHGGDELLADLASKLGWRSVRRRMYGRMVDEPRLGAACRPGSPGAPAVVGEMAAALGRIYGEAIDSVWVNYYRDGRDSVAWHRDRLGPPGSPYRFGAHPIVAIVSLGGPRRFALRPVGGGRSRSFLLGSGDLLVMGGDCQHHWEHAVPKAAQAPPRMSVTFRPKLIRNSPPPPATLPRPRARPPSLEEDRTPGRGVARGPGFAAPRQNRARDRTRRPDKPNN